MKTLYIDVYFLINFTVDLLAIYFASRISRVPVSTRRGILAAIVGGISASVIVFLESELVSLLLSVLSLVLTVYVAAGKVSARRRGKLLFSFLPFLTPSCPVSLPPFSLSYCYSFKIGENVVELFACVQHTAELKVITKKTLGNGFHL